MSLELQRLTWYRLCSGRVLPGKELVGDQLRVFIVIPMFSKVMDDAHQSDTIKVYSASHVTLSDRPVPF